MDGDSSSSDEEVTTEKPDADNHSFVALIDVVFNDGARRSCTGTIIHDNVVITAGHCFIKETYYGEKIDAELTASFIVIGTKKMFESGYEQYLPIEKVIAHPKYRGWTANLALVYTFAGMTSDKPGTVVPLAGERTSTPVDSNATILSWGHWYGDITTTTASSSESSCDSFSEDDSDSDVQVEAEGSQGGTRQPGDSSEERTAIEFNPESSLKKSQTAAYKYSRDKRKTSSSRKNSRIYRNRADNPTTPEERRSRYLVENDSYNIKVHREGKLDRSQQYDNSGSKSLESDGDMTRRPVLQYRRSGVDKDIKSYYVNWRRRMGPSQNKLTAEVFGFVNVQACKKLIEKATPSIYHSNGNDIVCYASEDHYITDEDAGAPAIQSGYLVAVTVGGVESDGEHVAVGMKMSCYCSWIQKNLPDNVQMNCCKDCCDVFHTVPSSKSMYRKHRNKYLL